jgi:hypothetical protein
MRYRYAPPTGMLESTVGTNSTNVDSFIHVGHTLDPEGSVHMDLLDSKWTDCLLLKTYGIADLH